VFKWLKECNKIREDDHSVKRISIQAQNRGGIKCHTRLAKTRDTLPGIE
jgi:hypothetical protein